MAPTSTTFGRKRPAGAEASRRLTIAQDLSPQAEAFRASLRSTPGETAQDFADWPRATRPRRWVVWAVGLALMAPGLLCFALHTPWSISIGLEVVGAVANAWLRQERRRHLQAIANWRPPAELEG